MVVEPTIERREPTIGTAIGQVLANALGVAISPVPIIAVILMLFSRAAARNAAAFLAGWLVGLAGVSLVVLALGFEGSGGGESDTGGALKVVIGVAFLLLAARQWRARPQADAAPEVPGWMSAIDSLSAVRALGLGLLLTVANPKNLGLTIAAASGIGGSGLSGSEEAVVVLVYVVLASTTIAAPVVVSLAAGERAAPTLTTMKEWLIANNATVMTVLFAVLGAKVLGDGLAILG